MLAKSGVEQLDKILQNRLNSEKVNRGEKKAHFFLDEHLGLKQNSSNMKQLNDAIIVRPPTVN